MGKKGKKAQAGKPKKLTPKDVGKRLDALVKKLEAELEGADLFAPMPPTEDCPICFVPLSRIAIRSNFMPCCGKLICMGCYEECKGFETEKRNSDCPFCREPAPSTAEDYLCKMEARASKNDSQALYNLGAFYNADSNGLPKDTLKALHYWIRSAELGNSFAMTNIGVRYNDGTEGPIDREKAVFFYRAGALNGNLQARHNLANYDYEFGNHQVGIRHWKIAAEAGSQPSLDNLKRIYNADGKRPGKEFISKEDLDSLYRACHEAQEEIKSEVREKHKEVGEEDIFDMFKC